MFKPAAPLESYSNIFAPISVETNMITEEEGLSAGIMKLLNKRKRITKEKENKSKNCLNIKEIMDLLYNIFR